MKYLLCFIAGVYFGITLMAIMFVSGKDDGD